MRRFKDALSAVKRSPRISMNPAVGSRRPVRQPMVVLLPEPFGPRKPNIEPLGTSSDRFSTATTVPYFFTRLEMRIASTSGPSFDYCHQLLAPPRERQRGAAERYA